MSKFGLSCVEVEALISNCGLSNISYQMIDKDLPSTFGKGIQTP